MRKKLFILSAICLILFATVAAQAEIKSPEQKGLSLTRPYPQKFFPNLARKEENQFPFNRQSNGFYPETIMNNKTWDKVKGTWNGPLANVITKVTGKSSNNLFVWTGAHSFVDAITDAKAHTRGNMKYFSGDGDWHIWKNCRDFSTVMITLNFSRRIFIEKIPAKEAVHDLLCIGLIRVVVFNTTMKIIKSGFGAYNDPFYNQHTLPYWWFEKGKFTDKYISTGRVTTPLFDGLAIGGFVFRKTWKF